MFSWIQGNQFTVEQIKVAHAKVKSGADYPQFVQEIIRLGVIFYETYVADGHTDYFGKDNYHVSSAEKYEKLTIAKIAAVRQFQKDLLAHQQGKTDYLTFSRQCPGSGVDKWAVCMEEMTCTYYDLSGNVMVAEIIPQMN